MVATGLKEEYPEIDGLEDFYGQSAFYCPYCDGWEMRDRSLIIVSNQPGVYNFTKLMYNWSQDLVVCTNGESTLSEEEKQELGSKNIKVTEKKVDSFNGTNGELEEVVFADGTTMERTGAFIAPTWYSQLDFLESIDYKVNEQGAVQTDMMGKSTIPGLFAAGESTTGMPTQLIVAASSGSVTATEINAELSNEQFKF